MTAPSPLDQYLLAFPERDTVAVRTAWQTHQPGVGLTPGEVILLGLHLNAEVTYGLTPDPQVWPLEADPRRVIAAQTRAPDSSAMWLVWTPEKGPALRLTCRAGRVVTITRSSNGAGSTQATGQSTPQADEGAAP